MTYKVPASLNYVLSNLTGHFSPPMFRWETFAILSLEEKIAKLGEPKEGIG